MEDDTDASDEEILDIEEEEDCVVYQDNPDSLSPDSKKPRESEVVVEPFETDGFHSFRRSDKADKDLPSILRIQVVDIEHETRWLPSEELDDREIRSSNIRIFTSGKKRGYFSPALVPCIRIYGTLEDGRSACANVYGYYPVVHLLPACNLDYTYANYLAEAVNTALLERENDQVFAPRRPENWRAVLSFRVVQGFVAFPYSRKPDSFLELKLSNACYIAAFGKVISSLHGQLYTTIGYVDVTPYSCQNIVDKFQADTGISGFGWVGIACPNATNRFSGSGNHSSCNIEVDCSLVTGVWPIKDGELVDQIAPLRMIAYDIECAKTRGMPTPERDPVIVIAVVCAEYVGGQLVPEKTRRVVLQHGSSSDIKGLGENDLQLRFEGQYAERNLLNNFGQLVADFDPDYLCGHNMIGFDQPYIVKRAHFINAYVAEELGRRKSYKWRSPRRVVKRRKNGETRETVVTDTPGRIQLDTLTWIMNGFVKERSYRLGYLASKYLGDTKDDVGYSMIVPLWKQSDETRARLAKYCLKDTELTFALSNLKQYQMVISSIEMSRQTRVPACKLLRSGVQVKVWALMLEKARAPHFDKENTPVFFPNEEIRERDKDDKFQGAEVLEPHRGYYGESWIGCGDFRSLYPSIIIG